MKQVIAKHYGKPEVLVFQDVKKPLLKPDDLLVKVVAVSVNSGDVRLRSGNFPRGFNFIMRLILGWSSLKQPVLGSTFSGEVEEVGSAVKDYKIGDRVYGMDSSGGSYAEYKVINQFKGIAKIPRDISYQKIAAIPFGAMAALSFVRDVGKVQHGHKVLVNGASGDVGINVVQLSKYYGAKVTGICSTKNIDFVKSLGANKVIDYTKSDPAEKADRYDLIIDTLGILNFSQYRSFLNAKGKMLSAVPSISVLPNVISSIFSDKKFIIGQGSEKQSDLIFLNKLIEEGKLKPVIDRTYTFNEIVDAHKYVETGHKVGSVVIKII